MIKLDRELISVIIPVYNAEKYINKCLESICSQTYSNIEIICVDDGSTDRSVEIISDLMTKDSRIFLIQGSHGGPNAARKQGLLVARGEYIGFVDSDDWIEDKMYASLMHIIRDKSVDLVTSDIWCDDENGKNINIMMDNYPRGVYTDLEHDLYPTILYDIKRKDWGMIYGLCCKLFKRELLCQAFAGADTRVLFGEDMEITIRYCLLADRVYVSHEKYYHYIMHDASICNSYSQELGTSNYYLYNSLKKLFLAQKKPELFMKQLELYMISVESHRIEKLYGINMNVYKAWDFSQIDKFLSKKIVIYGAGVCGRALYHNLEIRGLDENVVAWVDANPVGKKERCFNEIKGIDEISSLEFDYLIIAIKNAEMAESIKQELSIRYGIEEKIIYGKYTN